MIDDLLTEDELAAKLKLTPERTAELRKRQKWPHVRLNRFDVRYTQEQYLEIVRFHTVKGERVFVGMSNGLTARSARRAS